MLQFTFCLLAARCEETTEALVKSITTQVNHEDCFILLECINKCKKDHSSFHLNLARVFGSHFTLQFLTPTLRISEAHVVALAEALKQNRSLIQLDLSYNAISAQGAAALAEALKQNTSLTQLHLSKNSIRDQGATGLTEALEQNTSLTQLQLSRNHIGEAVISELYRLRHDNRSISLEQKSAFDSDFTHDSHFDTDFITSDSGSDSDSDSE